MPVKIRKFNSQVAIDPMLSKLFQRITTLDLNENTKRACSQYINQLMERPLDSISFYLLKYSKRIEPALNTNNNAIVILN
ncbi:hypothetical protein NCCP133_38260 [Cytobacillus sp. NCCP-133]|nr:hypothetical protein NCCP133_38260 [Cytobacillus sp. NCCP-133]